MEIRFYKALWGMEGPSLEAKLDRVAEAGYQGVESWVAWDQVAAVRRACEARGLRLVVQLIEDFDERLLDGLRAVADGGPEMIVTHAGRDHYPFAEGCRLWERVLATEAGLGVPVAHETHRARMLYSPWSTAAYLREFPSLRINADFSHWCCVSESLLERVPEMVDLAIDRAIHIHGRVGHEEGPQVSDPRAPEFARHLAVHKGWWERIRRAREADGTAVLRFVPEFGPPGYMPTLPWTRQPVADLWDVCLWMRDEMRKDWGQA